MFKLVTPPPSKSYMDLSSSNYIISLSSMYVICPMNYWIQKVSICDALSYLVLYTSYQTVQVNHAGNPPVRSQKLHMTQDRPK